MKLEPLKGKTKTRSKGSKQSGQKKWYMTRDIRAAVEWYIENINKRLCTPVKCDIAVALIKEAFEDVMK